MKREFSLKGRKRFREVFRRGKRFKGNFVQIMVLKPDRGEKVDTTEEANVEFKVGISVPKRFGKAHQRNWAKRRIRSIFSKLAPFISGNYFIIVKPEREFRDQGFSTIESEIADLLSRAGVLHQ